MNDLNRVSLIGRIGQDPEIKSLNSGDEMASFSLATSERWKDSNGEKHERTEWHRVCIFNKGIVALLKTYVKKGQQMLVEGQLRHRKFTNNKGEEVYITEVVIQAFNGNIQLLGSKSYNDKNSAQSSDRKKTEIIDDEILDDEIPF